jgi:hypothetical protein
MHHRAPSRRSWTLRRAALATLALAACGEHPPRAECTTFAEHYIELAVAQYPDEEDQAVARETAEGAKAYFINHCTDTGSKKTVDCGLEATTIDEFRGCFPDAPKKTADAKDAKDTKRAEAARKRAAARKANSAEPAAQPNPATPDAKANTPASASATPAAASATPAAASATPGPSPTLPSAIAPSPTAPPTAGTKPATPPTSP